MKAIKAFLTSTAKAECGAYLFNQGLVDKENPTIVQIRKALSDFSDEDLTKLATDLGYSEESSSENFDNLVVDLGFTKEECGVFTTNKGAKVAIINATYTGLTNSGNLGFSFSKGTIVVNNTNLLNLASQDKVVIGKQYPIKMDTIQILPNQVGYFLGQAIETAFDGIQQIYLDQKNAKKEIKNYKKDMRTYANASEEEIKKGVQDILSERLKKVLSA